jgi:D-serine deaminase-like pyridoxal phosphate-dependent protein
MEKPVFKPVGTSTEELDTPALVVDVDILDQNIETLHSFFREHSARTRPFVAAHKCPAIAHKQMAAGGTVGGVAVATMGEAEVFTRHGFLDISIANQAVTRQKIQRLCALARSVKITVPVDSPQNVRALSEGCRAFGVMLHILVDVHTRLERSGVEAGRPAVDLARRVVSADNLHFAGFMTYEGAILSTNPREVEQESQKCANALLDTKRIAEKEGIDVEVVSLGNTSNYHIVGEIPGVTEVVAGSYALMDQRYLPQTPQFKPAGRVLCTVTSHPDPVTGIVDAGQKAVGMDTGLAVVDGMPGMTLTKMSAEHGSLVLTGENDKGLNVGDKVWLVPWDTGICTNLYDYIRAVRNGKLEAVWDISARGHYR